MKVNTFLLAQFLGIVKNKKKIRNNNLEKILLTRVILCAINCTSNLLFTENFLMKFRNVLLSSLVFISSISLFSGPARADWLDVVKAVGKGLEAVNGNSSSSSSEVLEQQATTFHSSCQYPIKIAGYQIKNGSKQMVGWYTLQPYGTIVIDLLHKGEGIVAYYGEIATPNVFPNIWNGNSYRKTIEFNGKLVEPVLEQNSSIYLQCDNARIQPTQVDSGQQAPAPVQQAPVTPPAPPSLIQTY
jgi:hypothetical protein